MPLPYIQSTERMVGAGGPAPDTLNRALRQLLSESGYDPDADQLPGLAGPVFNVRAFGAVGDGTIDDTAAMQAGLSAITSIGGGVLYVPAGIYIISSALTYTSNTVVCGAGASAIIRNSSARSPANSVMLQPLSNGQTNVTLRDFVLDQRFSAIGHSSFGLCLSVNVVTGCTIDNVIFRDIINAAIWADTPVAQGVTKAIRVRGVRVEGSEGGGLTVFGNMSQWVVADSVFENTKDDPIAFQERADGAAPSDLAILGNVVLNCDRRNVQNSTPRGILLQGCSRFTVAGNIVNKTVADGICLIPNTVGCSHGTITGNMIYQAGITVDSTAGVPGNGIRVQDSFDITVSGNHAFSSREGGIRAHGVTDRIVISGNNFQKNGKSGMEIQNTRDFVVSDNLSVDNGTGAVEQFGIFVSSTTRDVINGVISGNRFGNSSLDGGSSQTQGIRFGSGGGFNPTDITCSHNSMIGLTSPFGGVAGIRIVKSRNRYSTGPMQGRAVLVNGTVTVSTTEVIAADNIVLTRVVGAGTTRGTLTVGTIVASTSFVIRSEDATGALSADDDSTVFWEIVH